MYCCTPSSIPYRLDSHSKEWLWTLNQNVIVQILKNCKNLGKKERFHPSMLISILMKKKIHLEIVSVSEYVFLHCALAFEGERFSDSCISETWIQSWTFKIGTLLQKEGYHHGLKGSCESKISVPSMNENSHMYVCVLFVQPPPHRCLISQIEVQGFIERCVTAVGAKPHHARSLADVLVEGDCRGHYSHGLNRLGQSLFLHG